MFLRRAVQNSPFADISFLENVSKGAIRAVREETCWFCLPAGQAIFKAGDLADRLYFLVSGSLGVFGGDKSQDHLFKGHIRPGEPVGEMALFLGGVDLTGDGLPNDAPHSQSVYAMRDCEIVSVSRHGFATLVKSHPDLLESMMRLVLERLSLPSNPAEKSLPRVYAVISTSPNIDVKGHLESLRDALKRAGKSAEIVHKVDGQHRDAAFFDSLERRSDVIFLAARSNDDAWFRQAMRQADRVLVLARSDARPSTPLIPKSGSPVQSLKLVDVILIDPGHGGPSHPCEDWRRAAGASRLFHWKGHSKAAADYLARVMSGRSVGVVFSGGGARAYAHIGAVRAIREAKINIDFAGGTSMGSVIAACVAMGWDDAEIDRRIRDGFVNSNPLGDYTLPIISLVKGLRVDKRLSKHFGDTQIGDMQIPFFAVSTDINHGRDVLHDSGSLAKALRASIALPGILPPIVDGDMILVDGGATNNFPANIMSSLHSGPIIGVDVSREESPLDVREFGPVPSSSRWVARNGLRAMPPIVSLLMRTATFSQDLKSGHKYADVVIEPELGDIELRDWKAYEPAVEAGYIATQEALKNWVHVN